MTIGLTDSAKNLVNKSWREESKKTYVTYIKKWKTFAEANMIDFVQPTEIQVANFLSHLFEFNLSYSAIKTARAAVATVIIFDYSNSKILKRIMKGVFEERPMLKRDVIWDVGPVLNYFKMQFPARKLTLYDLTIKVSVLLALVLNQRQQGMHLIDARNMTIDYDRVTIRFGDKMKNTNQHFHQPEIHVKAYPADKRLCPVWYIKRYLKATNKVRQTQKFFVITQKPYRAASKATIAGWIRKGLVRGGVDMNIFTPHSTRSAVGSARRRTHVPIQTILDTAGWSSQRTFANYYNKKIMQREASVQQLL